ncbi:hypothetical protein SMC26_23830 [Actinomadura fulvescens]
MARELRDAAEQPHTMPKLASLVRNIERWESGEVTRIREEYRLLYARAMNMTEHELFDPDDTPAPPPEAREGDVQAIRAMLTGFMLSDRQFGGERIRQQAAAYLGQVIEPRLRGHAPDALRRDLFAISTEYVMRLAAMHLDTDRIKDALGLLGRAAGLANESGDISLTAWVLSRRGEHEMHRAALCANSTQRRAHLEQALAYTEGAVGVARAAPPISRAFLTTKQALACSMTGDRAKTQRTLGKVWDAYDQAGSTNEPDWMGAYHWGHLRHEEAHCYVNLGMGRDAANAVEEALSVRTAARPRVFSLGLLAIARAQTLEVDEACTTAHQMITLAGQISSRRVTVRLVEVLEALKPYQNQPAVADVREAATPVLEGSPA